MGTGAKLPRHANRQESDTAALSPRGSDAIAVHPQSPYTVAMKFLVNLDRDETGMIVAECPAIPGCVSQGRTEPEALANIAEAIQACLESRSANGMPLTVAVRELEVSI